MILKHLLEGDCRTIRACSCHSRNILEKVHEQQTFGKLERAPRSAPFDATYLPNLDLALLVTNNALWLMSGLLSDI